MKKIFVSVLVLVLSLCAFSASLAEDGARFYQVTCQETGESWKAENLDSLWETWYEATDLFALSSEDEGAKGRVWYNALPGEGKKFALKFYYDKVFHFTAPYGGDSWTSSWYGAFDRLGGKKPEQAAVLVLDGAFISISFTDDVTTLAQTVADACKFVNDSWQDNSSQYELLMDNGEKLSKTGTFKEFLEAVIKKELLESK